MRLVRWIAVICVVLLLLYGVSPYFSFWRFTVALRAGDSAAVSARVDFPAIRASLKKQLVARFAPATSSHKRWSKLGPTLIDPTDLIALPSALYFQHTAPATQADVPKAGTVCGRSFR